MNPVRSKEVVFTGWWAIALKVHVAIIPILLPFALSWCVWVTTEVQASHYYMLSEERFDQSDARDLIEVLESKLDRLDQRARAAESEMARAITKLESIEQRLRGSE